MAPSEFSESELRRLVEGSESEHVEFKRRLIDPREAARSLAGLANSGGGVLIVGVEEGHGATGLDDPDRQVDLLEAAARAITPTLPMRVHTYELDGSTVVTAGVDSERSPYLAPDGAMIRRRPDGSSVPLSANYLRCVLAAQGSASLGASTEPRLFEKLEELNMRLDVTDKRLVETQREPFEERSLAEQEREAARRARSWQSKLVGWLLSGVIGALLGIGISAALG